MNKELHTKIYFFLALAIAFCLPFARFTPVFIALMLLNWLIEGDFKSKFQAISKNKFALLFISLYVMHLIGMLYTQNIDFGLFDIQVKFSLLIFPLILVNRPIPFEKLKFVFLAFIAGGIISSLYLIFRAIYINIATGENNFFYQAFSVLVHPSYIGMYLDFCVAWLLFSVLNKSFMQIRLFSFYAFSIILFFSFTIVLLSSKIGLITLILIFIGFLVYIIISRKKYLAGIIAMLFLLVSIYSMVRYVPFVHDRILTAAQAMSSSTNNQADSESTAVRLLIWKAADQVISENFLFGTGTGDSKDVLVKEYEKRGMTGALEHKLNTHNEFYQVFVSIGLIGFVLFMLSLLMPFGLAYKRADFLYIVFLLIIILNFIPESMLETQAGVMFYAFFNSLLCFSNSKPSDNNLSNIIIQPL